MGKNMENVRSRIDFKLVTSENKLIKWAASPRLKTFFSYNEDLAGLALKKQTVLLNKPIYIGFTVLDISKLIMFNFHYTWAVAKYGTSVKLCTTDTDSLFYWIRTSNVYEDMKEDIELFDMSDYPKDHSCFTEKNKKKLGTFKDETNSRPAREFIGLRAKCYSVLGWDNDEKKIAKGVPRVAIEKRLKHDMYKECLFEQSEQLTSALSIQSERHQIYTRKISKLSLSPYDDKRYIMDDGINTLAYGHFKIKYQDEPEIKKRRLNDS